MVQCIEDLLQLMREKSITTEVIETLYHVKFQDITESEALKISESIKQSLQIRFDQDAFELICQEYGWSDEQIKLTRVEQDQNLAAMLGVCHG